MSDEAAATRDSPTFDVVVVGGGPAGLSAALLLGRCRRSVLLVDDGAPRNAEAEALHGFLTRDGTPPLELLRLGREELERYGVDVRHERASKARCLPEGDPGGAMFEVTVGDGTCVLARRLLLATGVTDTLPDLDGLRTYYGNGVHHCPYCDGWEHRDQAIAVLGSDEHAVGTALGLLTWSPRVTLLLDGGTLSGEDAERLERYGVSTVASPVAAVGGDGKLERVLLEDGTVLATDALFFHTEPQQHSDLATLLGCDLEGKGEVRVRGPQRTQVPGLFIAGDADGDVNFVVVAAAEGAKAAVTINHDLQNEERP